MSSLRPNGQLRRLPCAETQLDEDYCSAWPNGQTLGLENARPLLTQSAVEISSLLDPMARLS